MTTAINKQDLCKKIYEISHLTGQFKLRSGLISHEYFDKYRFESQPNLLREIAQQMSPLIPKDTEVLAGLELGGVPVATALSLLTGIPVAFIRKTAKDYGTCKFAEGVELKNRKVCIIEDVITTGGQVVLSTKDLREAGALVTHVLCVIHRGKIPEPALAEINLELRSLFTLEELNLWGRSNSK